MLPKFLSYLPNSVLLRWLFVIGVLAVGSALSGCSGSSQNNADELLASSGSDIAVAVPRRVSESRVIDPSDLRLVLFVNGTEVDMSGRDSSGRATGSLLVESGVAIAIAMDWMVGAVVVANQSTTLDPLTDDRTEIVTGSWDFSIDDDSDSFTNFDELSAGTDPLDDGSFPGSGSDVFSILEDLDGLWDLTPLGNSLGNDVITLRIDASAGTLETVDYLGDMWDNGDDCSQVKQITISGVEDDALNLVAFYPLAFSGNGVESVRIRNVDDSLLMRTFDGDGNSLDVFSPLRNTRNFNTEPCEGTTTDGTTGEPLVFCANSAPVDGSMYASIANDQDLGNMTQLLRNADLGLFCLNLNDPEEGPWTVFAATDDAWTSFGVAPSVEIIRDQIYANGSLGTQAELLAQSETTGGLITAGNEVSVVVGTAPLTINGFDVLRSYINTNGAVHVINGVLE